MTSQLDVSDLKLIANKLSRDLSFYKDSKILITGGTGFFGKWILETFIYLNDIHKLNVDIYVLTRSPDKFIIKHPRIASHKKITFIESDIINFKSTDKRFDFIIHAATDVSSDLNKSDPKLMTKTILDGAENICNLAKISKCKRILYTSSGAVYGPQPAEISHISESYLVLPHESTLDAYSSAKLQSEIHFKSCAPCDLVIARCFSFAGPYQPLDSHYAFGNFIGDYLSDRTINIIGDGSSVRSYLYSADLVIWLLRILSSGGDREIYNVGSSFPLTIRELATKIGGHNVNVIGEKDNNVKKRFVPSVDKIFSELGVEETFTIDEIIEKTKKFYMS